MFYSYFCKLIESMMKTIVKRLIFFSLLLSFSLSVYGKGEEGRVLKKRIDVVKDLFENDMFVAAQKEIDDILSLYDEIDNVEKGEIEAYRLLSSIKLEQPNLDGQVYAFEEKYPYAPQRSRVKFFLASYYFNKSDYKKSYEIFTSVHEKYLPKGEKVEYVFDVAYCNLRTGNNQAAEDGFRRVISFGTTPFKASSQYYAGYLRYIVEDFKGAIEMFEQLKGNHEYSVISNYYILESYFMLKNYDYVIENGKRIFDMMEGNYKIKTARILSEAYYDKNMVREAKEYLEFYSKSGTNLSKKDNYYSGIVSYSLNSYYAAIDAFTKVADDMDSLGQSAYYHLGNSYMKIKNKHNAWMAYKAASEMNYDKIIKESAFFLYAKLSFDLNSDISVFNNYIKEFPSSNKSDEIYYYIATSYLIKKNFKSAIMALNKIKYLTPQMALNLQKAAFFRSMQLFDRGSFRSAITDFKIAIKNGAYNQSLTLLSKFWCAEAYYRLDDFEESININKSLIQNSLFCKSSEYPLALYNLGYGYFRLDNYPEAIHWFTEFLNLSPSKRDIVVEAKIRVADSYFMQKEYEQAAALYEEVATKNYDVNDIYASYMGALSFGLLSQEMKKIEMLQGIIDFKPDSPLYPKAMYELGRTYIQVNDPDKAIECFNLLIVNPSDSIYYSKSLLELGMINSNLGKYDIALDYFSKIVETIPLSEDAQSALAGIESIYQINNKPEEYLAYLDRIGMSSVKSADEKEMMLFNSAEQIFLSENYHEALISLESFIKKYPEGAKTSQAYFYMGETLNKLGKPELAADAYLKVMKIGEGSFAELSTLYYARICLDLEKYDQSIKAYQSLSEIAKFENNKYEAILGQMRAFFHNGNYADAAIKAYIVISSEKGAANNKIEATYILAKSYLSLGKREDALPLLKQLSKDNYSPEGAESAYLLILDSYDEGDFASVESQVYDLSDSKTEQTYWLAKSFIVLGDSFAERGEWEQALATFNSIKEGYTSDREYDDVLDQVKMRIAKIPDQKSEQTEN